MIKVNSGFKGLKQLGHFDIVADPTPVDADQACGWADNVHHDTATLDSHQRNSDQGPYSRTSYDISRPIRSLRYIVTCTRIRAQVTISPTSPWITNTWSGINIESNIRFIKQGKADKMAITAWCYIHHVYHTASIMPLSHS